MHPTQGSWESESVSASDESALYDTFMTFSRWVQNVYEIAFVKKYQTNRKHDVFSISSRNSQSRFISWYHDDTQDSCIIATKAITVIYQGIICSLKHKCQY